MSFDYDYIVVGGGSSGAVIAARLSEDPGNRVLLLEAGHKPNQAFIHMPIAFTRYVRDPAVNWGYATEPDPGIEGRSLPLPRGKVLGGSSSINGMLYLRGHHSDYDEWQRRGADGWSYEDVLPYFRKAENSWRGENRYHGSGGPLQVNLVRNRENFYQALRDSAVASGHPEIDDVHGDQDAGVARAEITVGKGMRCSTWRGYLKPAASRPNLTILTGAHATRVLLENGRTTGMEFVHRGERKRAYAAREVVLSAGAYNSPQLLMLSGIGPADHLRSHGIDVVVDLPGVGANLAEHPLVFLLFEARQSLLDELRMDKAAWSVLRWALTGTGSFADNGCAGNVFLRTLPGLARPDIQLMSAPTRMDAQLWMPLLRKRQPHIVHCGASLLHPDSLGSVRLRGNDPFAKPVIDLALFREHSDIATLQRGIRAAREIFNQPAMRELVVGEVAASRSATTDAELEGLIRKTAMVTHHPTGTCSMGTGTDAVLDGRLRVRGIEGLRVADASVMPTIPGGNTNAPCIMIGEKAADMILAA